MAFTQDLQSRDIIALLASGLDLPGDEWIGDVTNYVKSDKDSEKYVWLGSVPSMRQWVGGRQPKTLRENNFRVYNKDFEATLEIPVEWIRRDKTDLIKMRIAQLQEAAGVHNAELLSVLIDGATGGVCYDGQYFFDTDHSEGLSGTQSNSITSDIATPTAPTAVEFSNALADAIAKMYTIKDDQGRPTNASAKSFTVMVPVSMMKAAMNAIGADIILASGAGQTNPLKVMATMGGYIIKLVVNPRLTWTDKFAIFRNDSIIKPFVRQLEVDTEISAIAEGSEEEFKNKRHLYGVHRVGNMGYGAWQGSMLTTFV